MKWIRLLIFPACLLAPGYILVHTLFLHLASSFQFVIVRDQSCPLIREKRLIPGGRRSSRSHVWKWKEKPRRERGGDVGGRFSIPTRKSRGREGGQSPEALLGLLPLLSYFQLIKPESSFSFLKSKIIMQTGRERERELTIKNFTSSSIFLLNLLL